MNADPQRLNAADVPTSTKVASADFAESTGRSMCETTAPNDSASGGESARTGSPTESQSTRYVLQQILGRGSYGTVHLAFDQVLSRPVAVKVLHARSSSPPAEADVIREAQTLARMDHPRILPVYDVYRNDDGALCVVTKVAQGPSLADVLTQRRQSFAESARLVAEVADALQHTHERGIIHRDIKPANILLDADGLPLVTDFGLALADIQQPVRTGEVSGSPVYMSPEQVRGQSHHLDGRTDLWSLGVVLYECLTGRRPFRAEKQADLFEEILQREPKPPRMIDAAIPEELQRIVLRALQKDIGQRYAAAADFSADLRAWLATPSTALPRVEGKTPAHRAGWLLAVSLIVVLVAVIAARPWQWNRPANAPNAIPADVASTGTASSTPASAPPYQAAVNVRTWSEQNPARRGKWLHDPDVLPLHTDEAIRVEASIDPPGFAYLAWIDTRGNASPLYPWQPGDWSSRPTNEKPTSRISLPDTADSGWPLEGPAGMETLVLLVRSEPLPQTVDMQQLLAGLSATPLADQRAFLWFDDGKVPSGPDRGPRFHELKKLDDPLQKLQKTLRERSSPHFPVMRSVSFANAGAQP